MLQRIERIALFSKIRARDEESLPGLPETDQEGAVRCRGKKAEVVAGSAKFAHCFFCIMKKPLKKDITRT